MRQTKTKQLQLLKEKFKGRTSLSNLKLEPNLLLHPNVPKPLHTVNPRSIKGKAWWNKVRREAYNKMAYHCHACGHLGNREKADYLEGHEVYDINYKTGRVRLKKIVALCKKCHLYIHSGFCLVLLENGNISHTYYNNVRRHGFKTLADAGLPTIPTAPSEGMVEWGDFYLELDGVKHYSPFKNYDVWEDHHVQKDNTSRNSLKSFFDNILDKHHEGGDKK